MIKRKMIKRRFMRNQGIVLLLIISISLSKILRLELITVRLETKKSKLVSKYLKNKSKN